MKETGQDAPLVTLESLAVKEGRMDLETRQVTLERIMMEGGHAAMVLEKTGNLNLFARARKEKCRQTSRKNCRRRGKGAS